MSLMWGSLLVTGMGGEGFGGIWMCVILIADVWDACMTDEGLWRVRVADLVWSGGSIRERSGFCFVRERVMKKLKNGQKPR